MAKQLTQDQLNAAGVPNMYTPPSTSQSSTGKQAFITPDGRVSTDPSNFGGDSYAPLAPQTPQTDTSQPSPTNVSATPTTGMSQTNPTPSPITGNQPDYLKSIGHNAPEQPQATEVPSSEPNKFQQGFTNAQASKTQAPADGGGGRAGVASYVPQPTPAPYQPSQNFMMQGDPIMKQFMSAALSYQNDVISTGYTAKSLQATFANQLKSMDLQAMNLQNIMNGTRDDVRAEINKAGGFATESQVEGIVTTRNRDILKQYNNLELQRQGMQNQMNMQVQLAQADHQFAEDKFNNVMNVTTLYRNVYNNATDQIDKLVQNVGYTGLASAYGNDPYTLSIAEQHLNMPQGTLTNPYRLQAMETYRQQQLLMSSQRLGMQQERLNIYVGNNTANPQAISAQADYYATTGQVPTFKNSAQANAFWSMIGTSDPNLIADAQANKNIRTAMGKSLSNQTTQYNATKTAIDTVDKQLNLLEKYLTGAPNEGINKVDRSGVPLVNRYKNYLAGTYTGDPDVSALNNIITTTSREYAKILGGSAASISGAPVATQQDAEHLLNSSMTNGQLASVIKALRAEGNNRLTSYKDTMDSIQGQLKNLGKSGTSGMTTMMGPKGTFTVPSNQVEEMKKHGYK